MNKRGEKVSRVITISYRSIVVMRDEEVWVLTGDQVSIVFEVKSPWMIGMGDGLS